MSTYRFLADHYTEAGFVQAGSVASTADVGGILPTGWQPTGAVDPLDAPAVAAFYAMGPQVGWPIRQQWAGIGVSPAVTRWISSNPDSREFVLTGLGAGLAPRQYGVNGAAMGAMYP